MLPTIPGMELVEGEYCFAVLHRFPFPQVIEPRPGLTVTEIDAAIVEARELVRGRGREQLIWVTGPDHPWLADALAQRGLRTARGLPDEDELRALLIAGRGGTAGLPSTWSSGH